MTSKRIVKIEDIDKDSFKVKPPSWMVWVSVLVFLCIYVGIIFSSFESSYLKISIIVILTIVFFGLSKNLLRSDYLLTLIANKEGLYFYIGIVGEFYYVPWKHIGKIEKTLFPLNSRGLSIEVDCDYILPDATKVGNVIREEGRCFIRTIPQGRRRDLIIQKIEFFRNI